MSINFSEALSIAKAIGDVYSHRHDEGKLVSSILSSNSALAAILTKLNSDVVTGFDNVVSTIDQSTLISEWKPINNTLNTLGGNLEAYHTALGTIDKATSGPNSGEYVITYNNTTILFEDWCNGYTGTSGTVHPSRLQDMQNWVSPHALYNNSMASFVGIFGSFGPDAADTSGSNAIATWLSVCQAAQAFNNPILLGNMGFDTQFNSMMRFMDSISSLIKLTYYVHDSALQLLNQILKRKNKPLSDKGSIKPSIDQYFGSTRSQNTIWYLFAQQLDSLVSGTPSEQFKKTAFAPGMYKDPGTTFKQFRNTNHTGFWGEPVSLNNQYDNAFFSALNIVYINDNLDPEIYFYNHCHFGMQGTIVQVGTDMEMTVVKEHWPDIDNYTNSNNWSWTDEKDYTLNNEVSLGTYNNAYPAAPAPSSPNHITVITGFQFIPMQNGEEYNVGLALQFGELDVTDPKNPTVTIKNDSFIEPSWNEQCDIQQYFAIASSGNHASGSKEVGVITNACLGQSNGSNGASCISAQMAPAFYKSDFYQLSKLHLIVSS